MHVELEDSDDFDQVSVATAFSEAIHGALNVGGSRFNGGDRVGGGESEVVVAEYPDGHLPLTFHLGDGVLHVGCEASAVGVTQGYGTASCGFGYPYDFEGVVRVGAEAVEEVFGVEDHLLPVLAEVLHCG